jgi:hypothetical protein
MQPASATPKKSSKLLKGALYAAFALIAGGHFYSDYRQSQIREAQDALIEVQSNLIDAQRLQIELLKQEGGSAGGYCDDGFIIPDWKQQGPIEAKATKPARAATPKIV